MGEIGCEDRELIHSAIQCLPDKHQKAIIGRFWKHLTIEENLMGFKGFVGRSQHSYK